MNEVMRQEKKYLITLLDCSRFTQYFSAVMEADRNNQADGYRVRSLYFDTVSDRDYQEKLDGVEIRRKLRLRCYGAGDESALLEMKQKQGIYQKKRSLSLRREDASQLATGNYKPLLTCRDPFAAECYGLLHTRCYRPKTIIEYRRTAFLAKENNIRITFDKDICATEGRPDLFSEGLNLVPVSDPAYVVLEVKYNGFLLSYIKDLIREVNKSEITVSKYCLGRNIGSHNP